MCQLYKPVGSMQAVTETQYKLKTQSGFISLVAVFPARLTNILFYNTTNSTSPYYNGQELVNCVINDNRQLRQPTGWG
jgi:hypothetical protein